MKKYLLGIASILILFGSSSCNHDAEIAQLNHQLSGINDTCTLLRIYVNAYEYLIDSMNQQVHSFQNAIERDSIEFLDYLSNHKMVTTAIVCGTVGTQVGLDLKNEYPEGLKKIGAFIAGISALYAVTHGDEVQEVLSRSNDNISLKRKLRAAISECCSKVYELRGNVNQDQSFLAYMESRAEVINGKIAELK